jgi:hypothetical protein
VNEDDRFGSHELLLLRKFTCKRENLKGQNVRPSLLVLRKGHADLRENSLAFVIGGQEGHYLGKLKEESDLAVKNENCIKNCTKSLQIGNIVV